MLVNSNIYKRHQIISQQETDTNDNVQLYLGMFFLKTMKCSLQYGHRLCKNLNYYDCCMLYNCIIFLQCSNMSLFWVFSFIEATAWIKLFLLQLTMTTTIINHHSATRFLKTLQRISLKEVNWNNTHWKDCPYYQKIIFLYRSFEQQCLICTLIYLRLKLYIPNNIYFQCIIISCLNICDVQY